MAMNREYSTQLAAVVLVEGFERRVKGLAKLFEGESCSRFAYRHI